MRVFAAAVLLVAHSFSLAPAVAWTGWDLTCDTQVLRLDEPGHAWRLLDGFGAVAAGGGRALRGDAGVLVLLGAPGEETTIYVEGRTDGKKVELAATLNGESLGRRVLRRRLDTLAWPVPAGVARRGVNVLRLAVADLGAKAARKPTIVRIGVGPLRCRGRDPASIPVAASEPMTLSPTALVLASPAAPGSTGSDVLEISFDSHAFDTAVELSCWDDTESHPLATLRRGPGRRVRAFLPLGDDCAAARGFAVSGLGPGAAKNLRLEIDGDRDWRGPIRWWMTAASLFAVLGAFFLAVRLRSSGRLDPETPPAAGPLGLDVAAVVLVALAARIAFWLLYPRPGEAGDSYEYLLRAGFLINGDFGFWRDLDWHSWGHFIRPPGYFALLALLDGPSVDGRQTVIMVQLGVSALTAGVTYLVTFPLFGRLAAWCAGLLFACYLGSITTFSRILAEPIFIFLALLGLAGVAWLVVRPGWKLAVAAGVCFGLAALVRPGPIYYPPLAGLLLMPTLGWNRGLRLTAALVAGLAAVVLPWSLRNSLAAGAPVGVETVSVANLLLTHPDERVLPVQGLDLDDPEDYRGYRQRVHALERGPLTRGKGPHVRRILAKAARDPGAHLDRVGANLAELFGPVPDDWLRWILDERDAVRVARLTSTLNAQYGLVLIVAAVGFILFLRQPRTWPLAAWFFLNTSLLTFFFYSVARYREPTTPVLMAFAGGAIAAWVERLSVVKQPSLS